MSYLENVCDVSRECLDHLDAVVGRRVLPTRRRRRQRRRRGGGGGERRRADFPVPLLVFLWREIQIWLFEHFVVFLLLLVFFVFLVADLVVLAAVVVVIVGFRRGEDLLRVCSRFVGHVL